MSNIYKNRVYKTNFELMSMNSRELYEYYEIKNFIGVNYNKNMRVDFYSWTQDDYNNYFPHILEFEYAKLNCENLRKHPYFRDTVELYTPKITYTFSSPFKKYVESPERLKFIHKHSLITAKQWFLHYNFQKYLGEYVGENKYISKEDNTIRHIDFTFEHSWSEGIGQSNDSVRVIAPNVDIDTFKGHSRHKKSIYYRSNGENIVAELFSAPISP